MPANKYALIRYRVIDRCLNNSGRPYPSRDALREACEEALYGAGAGAVSLSTIDKDIYAMKNENELGYFAPIVFNREHGGYCYSEEGYSISQFNVGDDELSSIRFAAAILDQFRDVPVLNAYGHAIDKIVSRLSISSHDEEDLNQYIQFEHNMTNQGVDRLIPLLNCIKEKRKVFIDYKSFRENKTKNYEVHPKLLKEFDSRWYLIGYVPDRKLHLTFGLERIVDAIYTEQRIDSDVNFDAMAFFRFSIGITETKGNTKAEKITLRMKPIPGRLLKTQPLHNSQKVTKETDAFIEFKLEVYPSPELYAKLLSFGNDLEVVSPVKIRSQMRSILLEAMEKYKQD